MKLKNIELIDYMQTLDEFSTKRLPQKISYAITKNISILRNDVQVYNDSIQKIFEKYSEWILKDSNGDPIILSSGIPKVNDDHADDYIDELNELIAIEVDVDLYYISEELFDYDDSGKYDVLTAADIAKLERVICENGYTN